MASKLILHFQRLKINRLLQIVGNNKNVVNKIINIRFKNVNSLSRITFKAIKIPFLRSKIPNYLANLKYVQNRVIPSKIKLPSAITDFKYLNKGCNGVICSIDNDNSVIAKQEYKFDPYHQYNANMNNEHSILDKLQCHPNIIQKVNESEMVTDICKDPKFVSSCPDVEHCGLTRTLILERMEMNLEDLLKTTELNLGDRIDILSQILEAQVYMHHKSICHRDLKPSNILVKASSESLHLKHSRKFIVKVADFDCALDLNFVDPANFAHQGASISTSPEVLNMKGHTTLDTIRKMYSKNDIWAIGGMAYEIFGFENPFTKINAKTYSLDDLPRMNTIPEVVQRLVRTLVHPDNAHRYQSCVATDILQMYRLKSLIAEEVFALLDKMSLHMLVAFCYLNNLYYTGTRFLADEGRANFVLNYIKA